MTSGTEPYAGAPHRWSSTSPMSASAQPAWCRCCSIAPTPKPSCPPPSVSD